MLCRRAALRHLRFPEADGVVYPTLRYGAGTETEAVRQTLIRMELRRNTQCRHAVKPVLHGLP